MLAARPISTGAALTELVRRRRRRRLFAYQPYPRQYEFHAAGASFRQRCLMAGNQEGKTYSAAHEVAMHVTGLYPDWWPGKKFTRAVLVWTASESNESSREIIQSMLLGTEECDMNHPDFGTGTIPGDSIIRITRRQAGVTDVVDQIMVRHKGGGTSRIVLKAYEQKRPKFQGKKVDIFWPDEEPDDPGIYSEGLTRTQAADGGMTMLTFTPLRGYTSIVKDFLEPQPGEEHLRHTTNMTIYECTGGTWPEDTPWAGQPWTGHYTESQTKDIVAAWKPYERDARAKGIPIAGEGRVFLTPEEDIMITPFPIPRHFRHIAGIDFGMGHPFAHVCCAYDADQDVFYVYDAWRKAEETPSHHAVKINKRGKWIPVAWPHDGENRDKDSGVKLQKSYRKEGVKMLGISARYDNDTGGRQAQEPVIVDIDDRMQNGTFKVFSHLDKWFEEYRRYHRKDGKIVAVMDDILKATFYAYMMRRYARPGEVPVQRVVMSRPPLKMWG
jgi:phage terminase large subunit-like protein